jgi:hypothetical protein
MFHPLLASTAELKTPELEEKISELNKKYFIAARSGNSGLCQQILVALEAYRYELQNRNLALKQIPTNNGNVDLDGLINIS